MNGGFSLLAAKPRAKVADAVSEIVGQLREQFHLRLVEGVRLRGRNPQRADHLTVDVQRKGAGGFVAKAKRLRAPRCVIGVGQQVAHDARFARAD